MWAMAWIQMTGDGRSYELRHRPCVYLVFSSVCGHSVQNSHTLQTIKNERLSSQTFKLETDGFLP